MQAQLTKLARLQRHLVWCGSLTFILVDVAVHSWRSACNGLFGMSGIAANMWEQVYCLLLCTSRMQTLFHLLCLRMSSMMCPALDVNSCCHCLCVLGAVATCIAVERCLCWHFCIAPLVLSCEPDYLITACVLWHVSGRSDSPPYRTRCLIAYDMSIVCYRVKLLKLVITFASHRLWSC